jgi:hypothetical protein
MVRVIKDALYVHFGESLVHFAVVVHHKVDSGVRTSLPLFKCAEKL